MEMPCIPDDDQTPPSQIHDSLPFEELESLPQPHRLAAGEPRPIFFGAVLLLHCNSSHNTFSIALSYLDAYNIFLSPQAFHHCSCVFSICSFKSLSTSSSLWFVGMDGSSPNSGPKFMVSVRICSRQFSILPCAISTLYINGCTFFFFVCFSFRSCDENTVPLYIFCSLVILIYITFIENVYDIHSFSSHLGSHSWFKKKKELDIPCIHIFGWSTQKRKTK